MKSEITAFYKTSLAMSDKKWRLNYIHNLEHNHKWNEFTSILIICWQVDRLLYFLIPKKSNPNFL